MQWPRLCHFLDTIIGDGAQSPLNWGKT